jgi:Tfp pilus assembly protein PilV
VRKFIFNQSGVSLIESMVAAAVITLVLAAFATATDISQKTMRGSYDVLEVTNFQNQLVRMMAGSFALGAGYASAEKAERANAFDPDSFDPQPVTILDPDEGLTVEHTTSQSNSPPASAMVSASARGGFVIREITLQKKSGVAGAGDIGPEVTFTSPVSGALFRRRTLFVDLHLTVENLNIRTNVASSVQTLRRSIPLSIMVEAPDGTNNWLIAKSSTATGGSFSLGWSETDSGCQTLTDPNTAPPESCAPPICGKHGCFGQCDSNPPAVTAELRCSPGQFMVSQHLTPVVRTEYVPCGCGKSGCASCEVSSTEVNLSIRCCNVKM